MIFNINNVAEQAMRIYDRSKGAENAALREKMVDVYRNMQHAKETLKELE